MSALRLCFGILVLLVACNPASKLVNQGNTQQTNGDYEAASTFYYNALLRKPGYAPAKEALSITAQKVLNDKFGNFNRLVVENNVDEAMKVYKNAEKWSQTSLSVGVPLRWPNEYDEVYFDIRAEYISKLYDEALLQMNQKRYEQAEQTFERIATLDTSYRGITVLRLNTVLEPLYQHGLIEMQQGKFKQAYQTFSKIVNQDESYKNSKALRDEANTKAITTVGVLPPFNLKPEFDSITQQLPQMVTERLKQKRYAYVKIENEDQLAITLQNRGWVNLSDSAKAIEAAKVVGLKYAVWIRINHIEFYKVPLTTIQKSAYEAFSENILNPYTGTYSAITKFRKVNYDDTYEENGIRIQVHYQLISVNDGKVVLGDELNHTQKDEVHQLVFNGNIQNLYEDLPSGNYLPPAKPEWRDLFSPTKRKPIDDEQLTREALFQLSKQIAKSVQNYFK